MGVGKTHAAQALGHAACRVGLTVLFTKTNAYLRDLAGGRADGSWEPRLRRDLQSDVLILDDFGMREFTPTQAEDLYELICERYRTGSMIVTSNRAPSDWYPLFPNPVLAESASIASSTAPTTSSSVAARTARSGVRTAVAWLHHPRTTTHPKHPPADGGETR